MEKKVRIGGYKTVPERETKYIKGQPKHERKYFAGTRTEAKALGLRYWEEKLGL